MISILTPARGRFSFLERTLNSIISNANSKNNFEILIGLDNDDISTIEKVNQFFYDKDVNFTIVIFERLFYKNFHLYIDGLYKRCNGDYIWTLPDDCEIITKDWDSIILREIENLRSNNDIDLYLKPMMTCGYNTWNFSIIPIISTKWIEITGRISEFSQTDMWLGTIASGLNIVKEVNITCNLFNPSDGSQHSDPSPYFMEMDKDKEKLKSYIKNINNNE